MRQGWMVCALTLWAGLAAAQPAPRVEVLPLLGLQFDDIPGKEVPYVPTPPEVVDAMLDAVHVTGDDLLYDLGCGDGRIVIAAAKRFGTRGVGIDIDPQRIAEANANAKAAGVEDLVEFREQNLFEVDLRRATVVTLYLLSSVNLKLRPKLLREVRPGTRVVSHAFDMGDWLPDQELTVSNRAVYVWRVDPEDKEAAR
jgi:SAM-dependent methyltransferase